MGITDYIKTRLLNNRVEQYNTKRSYWGEDERQPRTDGINTGLDLIDALPPVINKTIANARYAVKLDGYTSGILKNRIDKANVNMVLVDKENKLSQEQKLTLILWARKIDISQVAKNILQGGMVDGEGLIKPVERWDKSIGKYIKPIFLEIGARGYGLKKEFNDDNEVQLYLYEMPKDIVAGSPEEFANYVNVEEGTLTVKYEPEEVINFMYNEIYCEAQSIILNCLDEYCDSDFKNFIALRVNDSFNLLGVWTVKGQINGEKIEYVGMIHEFFDENTSLFDENLIMCGDFNSNSIWDKQNRKKDKEGNAKNQTNMNRKLESCNLISTYHKLNNEEQGKESQSTFYLYRHLDKPYHIDYVYAAEGIVTDLKILDAEDWIEVSDHVPIVFEID